MEAWEGASPLWATGVYMSAADVERVREREEGRAGKLLRLIPALSFFFFFNIKVLLLLWAPQLREYTCVWARRAQGTKEIETHRRKRSWLQLKAPCAYLTSKRKSFPLPLFRNTSYTVCRTDANKNKDVLSDIMNANHRSRHCVEYELTGWIIMVLEKHGVITVTRVMFNDHVGNEHC